MNIGGQQTSPIVYADTTDADPLGQTLVQDYAPLVANVQRALDEMLGPGNALVLVSPTSTLTSPVLTIQYTGALAGTDVPAIVITNEVQRLSFSAAPSGGTFKIRVVRPDGSAVTTGNIAASSSANTTANNIASALNSSLGAGSVTVSAANNKTYDITFSGPNVSGANLALVTITSNSVTPSLSITPQAVTDGMLDSGTVVATTVTDGIGNSVQRLNVGGTAGGKLRIVFEGTQGSELTVGPTLSAADVEASLNTISVLTGNVKVIGHDGGPFLIVFSENLAGRAVPLLDTVVAGGATASVEQDTLAAVSSNEVQKLTFGATSGTIINAGTATFTLSLPIGQTGSSLTTQPIAYTNDPVALAANMQYALNMLLAVPGQGVAAGQLVLSDSSGLGHVIVTPLTPIDFAITFQDNMASVNWPQLSVSVTQGGGSNVTVTPSTIYNGAGNSVQTLALSGSNNNDFILAFNGVAITNTNFIFRNDGAAQPSATNLRTAIEQIPELAGNVFVIGRNNTSPATEGPFYIVFKNQLAGVSVPLITSSSDGNNVTAKILPVDGTPLGSESTPGVPSIVLNGGLLGVGTDVLSTGGVAVWRAPNPQNPVLDSQIFAEDGPRTIKAVNYAVPNSQSNVNPAKLRLGGRREFGNQNTLTISQMQLTVNAFPTSAPLKTDVDNSSSTVSRNYSFIVDDPQVPVQIGSADTQQIVAFPTTPSVPFAITLNTGTFPAPTTGLITGLSFNSLLDASVIQTALNNLFASNLSLNGGQAEVSPILDATYSFLIKFKGAFAGQEVRLVSISPSVLGAVVSTQSRGGGSLIEGVINPLTTTASMNVLKEGAGTLILGGNNTYKGATTVDQGVLKVISQ